MSTFQMTHLAALAAYLPYRPRVQYNELLPVAEIPESEGGGYRTEGVPHIGRLTGLLENGTAFVRTPFDEEDDDAELKVADLKLVLKPFAQLIEQLPDGTVPFWQMAEGWIDCFDEDRSKLQITSIGALYVQMEMPTEYGPDCFELDIKNGMLTHYHGWSDDDPAGWGCFVDQLRSLGFAVGIPADSWIPAQ